MSNAAWVNAASLGLSAACYANDVAQQVCVCVRARTDMSALAAALCLDTGAR